MSPLGSPAQASLTTLPGSTQQYYVDGLLQRGPEITSAKLHPTWMGSGASRVQVRLLLLGSEAHGRVSGISRQR